ncbi:TIGR03862 family flavoprotein [Donghicola sp.]|jgi:uncharacterized flavoprotein (TIGR03862 family)|uniref:TIGR03862 family flavoprotein n=1 Tax=Donghicola sp. TaxID=1929294 RepID=UPI0025ED5C9C|nr:TIGR03862 family flavoprotein [Donghicola sp.]MCT4578471.1 TIGR03862 family flavoprotein [Donghicola sp.]
MVEVVDALVIGAGPAGLMAAEMLGAEGRRVVVLEAKPSVARKFLMAGKSGLNITKDQDMSAFVAAYGAGVEPLVPALRDFGPVEVMGWAEDLGVPLFVGSSGRVFPKVMKASPLLRSWLRRLEGYGVEVRVRQRWAGWDGDDVLVDGPDGRVVLRAGVTVLACGGASWARLGSDGAWAEYVGDVASFQPANMGFLVDWSEHMVKHFGEPVKDVALIAGDQVERGEFVVSARGVEGGGIYAVSRAVREGADLRVDLLPHLSVDEARKRLARGKAKDSLANRLRKTLSMPAVKVALVQEFARPSPDDLAPVLKGLPLALAGPRPLDEAISVAGGLRFSALDGNLMLRERPGVFACGEMLDWEAPTGGYLLTACLASGRWAGLAAARY